MTETLWGQLLSRKRARIACFWILAVCVRISSAAGTADTQPDIQIDTANQTVRYHSGGTVYVEGLRDGRWQTFSWGSGGDAQGQEFPTGHDAFELRIKDHPTPPTVPGTALSIGWQWTGASDERDKVAGTHHVAVELYSLVYPIRLKVHTLADGTPIFSRWLEITNLSSQPIALTSLSPWAGGLWPADATVEVGHSTHWELFGEGWFGWTPLNQGRNIFDQDRGLAADDPYFLLRNPSTGEYFFGELGWPVNYRMEFDRGDDGISFSVGPREFNALRVVDPGESIQTPVVHLGLIKGDFDAAVQAMHAHIRRSVLPPQNPKNAYLVKYLLPEDQALTVYRGRDFNEQNIKRTMDVAAAAGAEVVIVSGPTWCSTYGDWLSPNPWLFPRGMQPLVEYAHQKGLLFGLYFEAEGGRSGHVCNDSQAACIRDWRYSKIYNEHRSWFVPPDNVLNLAMPEAAQYLDAEVPHIIDYYHLDLYRQDFNSFLRGRGSETLREGFLESDYWRHYEALYRTFQHLRETHPDTLVLSGAAGGMRLDLDSLATFPQDTSTDRASYPSLYRMAAGLSTYLPPEVLNTPNGMPTPGTPSNNMPDLDTLLRGAYALGNTPMLFNAILPKRIEDFKPATRERFLHYANLYKSFIRPLLPISKVFHIAPVDSTNGVEFGEWLAIEFTSADATQGWATVIRLSEHSPDLYSLKLKGLEPGGEYRVTFDNTGTAVVRSGLALMRDSLAIQLKAGQNSELLLFEQVQIPERRNNSGD